MTVVVQLRGGLGNQLFQYAAGYALSTRLGVPLTIDTILLPPSTIDRGGVRRWPEQISSFNHAGVIVDSGNGDPRRKRVAQSLAGRERSLGDSRFRGLLGPRVYARERFDDVDAFERLPDHSRINAYCNSPRFFVDVSDAVCGQIRSLSGPGGWYQSVASEMDTVSPIAVHVRWGDYLNLRHVYGSIAADYYKRALAEIVRATGEHPVWLFSDEPSSAADFLRSITAIDRVVEATHDSSPLENLLLLSRAKGIACANSSFSWWAAYLANAVPGSIVFPRPLFARGGPPEPKDWLAADWIQVGRD